MRSSYWSSPIHPASCWRHQSLVAANSNAVVVYRGGIQPIASSASFMPDEAEAETDVHHGVRPVGGEHLHRVLLLGVDLRDRAPRR